MPSNAFNNYENSSKQDTYRLMDAYNALSALKEGSRGRRALDHVTRSAVVMLCGAWETYVEDVLLESVRFIAANINDATMLNLELQKLLCQEVKKDKFKGELGPIFLAGEGWKAILEEIVTTQVNALNTPKAPQLDGLFKSFFGIEISSHLRTPQLIDNFVTARGGFAHRSAEGDYIRLQQVQEYLELVDINVRVIEQVVCERLNHIIGTRPWRMTASNRPAVLA